MPNAPPTPPDDRPASSAPHPRMRVRVFSDARAGAAPSDLPLTHSLTLGASQRCDVVLRHAGVRDRHATLEPTPRGPSLVLASKASARVNAREVTGAVGLMPGDEVEIGTSRLVVALDGPAPRFEWRLLSGDARASLLIAQPVEIGRDPDCQLRLPEPDIAPRHARLVPRDGLLWVQDPSDAGTYLDGERVHGARLAHADDRLQVGHAEFHIAAVPIDEASIDEASIDEASIDEA
jgi:predicted component of type VI protein secretion system